MSTMKTLILIGLTVAICAQEIVDLGVISSHKAIVLESCRQRSDFLEFRIDLIAQRWPSNSITIIQTNNMLTLEDLVALPPGPVIMGVKSVCRDGEQSPIRLFLLDIRRDPPAAPSARVVEILTPTTSQSTTNILQQIKETQTGADQAPPIPGKPEASIMTRQSLASSVPELPGASSETYSEHIVKMQKFYAGQRK